MDRELRRKERNRLAQKKYRESVKQKLKTLEGLLPPSQPPQATTEECEQFKSLPRPANDSTQLSNAAALDTGHHECLLAANGDVSIGATTEFGLGRVDEPLFLDFSGMEAFGCARLVEPQKEAYTTPTEAAVEPQERCFGSDQGSLRAFSNAGGTLTPSSSLSGTPATADSPQHQTPSSSRREASFGVASSGATPEDTLSALHSPISTTSTISSQAAAASPSMEICPGDTPLHSAARAQKPSMVKLLLQHGFDACAQNRQGQTPLHCAASSGCCESARHLIQSDRFCRSVCDLSGATPLHVAAAVSQEEIVRLLLSTR